MADIQLLKKLPVGTNGNILIKTHIAKTVVTTSIFLFLIMQIKFLNKNFDI